MMDYLEFKFAIIIATIVYNMVLLVVELMIRIYKEIIKNFTCLIKLMDYYSNLTAISAVIDLIEIKFIIINLIITMINFIIIINSIMII